MGTVRGGLRKELAGWAVASVARLGNGTTIPGAARLGVHPDPANAVPSLTVPMPYLP